MAFLEIVAVFMTNKLGREPTEDEVIRYVLGDPHIIEEVLHGQTKGE